MKTKRQEEFEDTIRHAGRYFDHFELIGLLGITYKGICDVKNRMEGRAAKELSDLLSNKLVDRYYSLPFDLQAAIESIDLPYKADAFKKKLKSLKMPYEHIEAMLKLLEDEYKIDEDE